MKKLILIIGILITETIAMASESRESRNSINKEFTIILNALSPISVKIDDQIDLGNIDIEHLKKKTAFSNFSILGTENVEISLSIKEKSQYLKAENNHNRQIEYETHILNNREGSSLSGDNKYDGSIEVEIVNLKGVEDGVYTGIFTLNIDCN
ncbi:MAG: hypothetical protein KAH04_07915 [Psychrilyobacter sp.]|nr:hypothetical protein [Psychrilyobacter sp.]